MKHLFLLLFVCVSALTVSAQTPNNDYPKEIVITPMRPISTNRPRTPMQPEIEAFYADGTIMLEFAEDMGYVSVVVINETTGESWVDGVDGCGSATISISDMAGYYTITISTTSGDYYGEFTL